MRIFTGFLIILCSVFLWLLPVSNSVYAWKTNPRTDTFNIATAVGVTTANSTLLKPIYDNDTATIVFASSISEVPVYVSYNTTTRLLAYSGLSANTTRSLGITYDVTAFTSSVFDTVGNYVPWLIYLIFTLFPLAGLISIFWDRIANWFG